MSHRTRKGMYGQTSLRLHADLLARLDAMIPRVEERMRDQTMTKYLAVNRSDVMRIAIEKGLGVLELEFKEPS